MKRLLITALALVMMLSVIVTPARAESYATLVESFCTITPDGDCLVNLTVTLHLDNSGDMTFPLPANATDITMNNASARTTKTDDAIYVDIGKVTSGLVGDFTLRFDYTIPKAVKVKNLPDDATKAEKEAFERAPLQLTLPLLCGFAYPVQILQFVVVMPAKIQYKPTFTSIYRQNGIASDLNFVVKDTIISGSSINPLNDHEGITMTMDVSTDMFPSVSTYRRTGNPELVPMLILAGLALLYWLLFLRTLPLIRSRHVTAPEGITAGELGCRLTLSGGDLTMMVMSWAQLGYIIIQLDNHGRILLHKRMDMGTERSLFEVRVFQMLFGKNKVIDGTGSQYARLCCKVARMVPGEKTMYSASSGNIKLFRFLCCASHVCAGVNVGMNLSSILALQILLAVILAVVAAITSWHIQEIAYRTHIRGKIPVYFGLGFVLLWVLLGLLAGQVWIPLGSAFGQWALGYFAAYGGRRSDLGRVSASQILGLRAYLKTIPKEALLRLRKLDPDYFFNMAPYALALGIIHPFARCFAGKKMDPCPYMISGVRERRTAAEWASILAATADRLDERQRRMQVEKWAAIRFR